ncbi:hypothetical protein [Myroides guanonis]|uniref:Uncharacterized protein n=1 Tax=Myroides guanonis TaxID=1150112 RepID=A0A1I3Q0V7_9FLAO|nr:hypothetical protein [Myroides guanonis]SFJ26786.1 hypothetical protein SAMN04487893_1053 [Myroides guanonis]
MERRDYLLDMIEKMAQFLRMLLQQLSKKEISEDKAIEKIGSYFNIDFQTILGLEKEVQWKTLNDIPNLNSKNQELLADFFVEMAEKANTENPQKAIEYRKLALHTYENINNTSKEFDMTRFQKITALKTL